MKTRKPKPVTFQTVENGETRKQKKNEIIRSYHNLQKKATNLDLKLLDKYQKASVKAESIGQFACGKWLKSNLDKSDKSMKLSILDVGNLTGRNYSEKYFNPTYIDLNPQQPNIQKQDLLTFNSLTRFNIVCLSLVINFSPVPSIRGEMILSAKRNLELNGRLFIVLPLPCIMNSRYLTHEYFIEMMLSVGFKYKNHLFTNKLALYLFENTSDTIENGKFSKKALLRDKGGCNNFAIVFKS